MATLGNRAVGINRARVHWYARVENLNKTGTATGRQLLHLEDSTLVFFDTGSVWEYPITELLKATVEMDRSEGNVLASSLGIRGKSDRVWFSDARGARSVKAPEVGDQIVLIPRDSFNALALQALALVPVADAAPVQLALDYLFAKEARDEHTRVFLQGLVRALQHPLQEQPELTHRARVLSDTLEQWLDQAMEWQSTPLRDMDLTQEDTMVLLQGLQQDLWVGQQALDPAGPVALPHLPWLQPTPTQSEGAIWDVANALPPASPAPRLQEGIPLQVILTIKVKAQVLRQPSPPSGGITVRNRKCRFPVSRRGG